MAESSCRRDCTSSICLGFLTHGKGLMESCLRYKRVCYFFIGGSRSRPGTMSANTPAATQTQTPRRVVIKAREAKRPQETEKSPAFSNASWVPGLTSSLASRLTAAPAASKAYDDAGCSCQGTSCRDDRCSCRKNRRACSKRCHAGSQAHCSIPPCRGNCTRCTTCNCRREGVHCSRDCHPKTRTCQNRPSAAVVGFWPGAVAVFLLVVALLALRTFFGAS